MKILFVSSEAAPFAASGGLGDVMGALPKAVKKCGRNDCAVILPLYGSMKEEYRKKMKKVADITFRLSWRNTGASVFSIVKDGVTYYFVENHYYFDRPNLYGEYDDGERFAFFSTAVVEFMRQTGNIPDVLHANDWQSALSVIYLKTEYSHIPEFAGIKTLYTIHNIEYQGKYDPYILGDVFGIDGKYYHHIEHAGCINLMKGAIVLSDYVNTVSPHYAEELTDDFFAFGLSGIIRSVKDKMCGIINGIDNTYFNPEIGGDIETPYTVETVKKGKAANKLALQNELGLTEDTKIPMIAMITRLTAGKGIDLVVRILDELLEENVQFVVLGTGDKEYEYAFATIAQRHDNCKALIKFDRVTSKKIYASADLFLMPSKSEPCGLSQMIACAYGTLPVVRSVGGLYDSIEHYHDGVGNGFRFDNFNAHELLFTVKDALALYENSENFDKAVQNAMNTDFTWKKSAKEYLTLYKNITKSKDTK